MTAPPSLPLAVHHPVSTHHQSRSHEIEALQSTRGQSAPHRCGEPAAVARTLDTEEKGCVKSETGGSSSVHSGCGGGGGGCVGVGNGGCYGGGVVAAPNLAVTFSVGTQEQQQQGKQQQVDSGTTVLAERPPRPLSIESAASVEGVPDNSREASSYVWRLLVYLAFVNPALCFLNALYAIVILLGALITYPIRSFISKDHSYQTTPGLAYLLLLHLRFIYPQSARSPHPILPLPEDFDPGRLIFVHLFGPFLAVALAVPSWILVFVWIYTEVLLGEKNEGRGAEYRSVMFVKERWEQYILVSLKPKSLGSY